MINLATSQRHFSIRTSDIDEAEQIYMRSIARARMLKVTDKDKLKLELDFLNFERVFLILNSFNIACEMEADLEVDDFRLVIAPHEPTQFLWQGKSHTASLNNGVVVNPGFKIKNIRYSRSKTLVINTSFSTLKRHLEELTGEPLNSPIKFFTNIDLTKGHGAHFLKIMSNLSFDASYDKGLLHDPGIRRGYCELILGAILSLPHNYSNFLQPADSAVMAPRLVQQAEEYMRSHFGECITITDLTREFQCTQKVLFSSFRSSRDYTPMAFLLEQRLQAARQRFLDPNFKSYNISEIAYSCGFAHLGRFSSHYKRRFGELPSETLKKNPD